MMRVLTAVKVVFGNTVSAIRNTPLAQALARLLVRIEQDSLSLVAAGVAFYIFLSIFPALATAISLYGLVSETQDISNQIARMEDFMPPEALGIIAERAKSLASNHDRTLTLGMITGLLVSLWSANKAMKAIAEALNIAYDISEDRNIIKKNLVTLGLTLFSTAIFILALVVVVLVPVLVTLYLSRQSAEILATLGSWLVFIGVLLGLFLILYGYAPARHRRPWRDLFPGAAIASFLLIIASMGFSAYVANFGKYDEQYGALGAVVVTLLWLFIGAFIFLMGAEINADLKLQKMGGVHKDETGIAR